MILVQISDSHITLDEPQAVQRDSDLRRTVAAINQLEPQPDAVIHTGDLANRGQPQEYAKAVSLLRSLRSPFYPVPGNRDDRAEFRACFINRQCFPCGGSFVQYCIDHHPVRLLGLDTQSYGSQKGDYCDERHAALLRVLAEKPARPTAVFLHHPPFEVAGDKNSFQFETRAAAARLIETLTKDSQVLRIFCGHAHRTREVVLNGVVASTISSTATDLRQGADAGSVSTSPRFQIHRYQPARGFSTTTSMEIAA